MGTIFLAGIYGVGKSTLAHALTTRLGVESFSAGDLISKENGETYGTNKAVSDKNKNQDILETSIAAILQKTDRIILAGHFCILNQLGEIEKLPDNVFEKLQIEKIILLEASPQSVVAHLFGRDGKSYSLESITAMMEEEHRLAAKTARRLHCPLIIHEMKYMESDVQTLLSEL